MYAVRIEAFEGAVLAGLPHQGNYLDIGPVFDRLFHLAESAGIVGPASLAYGMYFDNPEETPVDQLRSLAAVSVLPTTPLDAVFQRFELPAGRYAIVTHTGPYAALCDAYQYLYREWLPNSGEVPVDFPSFEQYLNDASTTPEAQLITRIGLLLKT